MLNCWVHNHVGTSFRLHIDLRRAMSSFEFRFYANFILFGPRKLSRIPYIHKQSTPTNIDFYTPQQTIEIPSWMRSAIIIYFVLYQLSNRTHNWVQCHWNDVTFVFFSPFYELHSKSETKVFQKDVKQETRNWYCIVSFTHQLFGLSSSFSSFENIFQVKRIEMKTERKKWKKKH